MTTPQGSIDTSSRFPWAGAIVTGVALCAMIALSVWFWPQLSDGVISTQRSGRDMVIPGWFVAGLTPALTLLVGAALFAAQPVRIRTASALNVPLWRTDHANRRSTTLAMVLSSVALLGAHVLVLSMAGDMGLRFGVSVMAFCLGLILVGLGNAMPKLAPLSDQQRAYFPRRSGAFVNGYRAGAHRTMRKLAIPTMALGVVTCALAFVWPYIALSLPMLSALSLLIPGVTGLINGAARRDSPGQD